jgi:predicted DNA-binding protein (MmcQ/YjbR family)
MKKVLERARKICLSFPGTTEKEAWGSATFRCGKMFAMFDDNHHGDGRVALLLKAGDGVQEILVGAEPAKFFVPPYVGPSGWIGIRLDGEVDWDEVTDLVRDAYELTAAKQKPAAPAPPKSKGSRRGGSAPARRAQK